MAAVASVIVLVRCCEYFLNSREHYAVQFQSTTTTPAAAAVSDTQHLLSSALPCCANYKSLHRMWQSSVSG